MNNHSNYTPSQIAVSIIFLIWFFGSILAMVFFARNNMGYLAIGVFGQYFLVFGIIAVVSGIKNKNFNPIFLIVPIVGLGAVIVSVIAQFGSETVLDVLEDSIPYLLLGVFFIAGLIMMIMAFCLYFGNKMRCKDYVVGTCVELLEQYNEHGELLVCPVYEANYGMHKLRLCNYIYTNMSDVNVGDVKDLYVNPNNPEEFCGDKGDVKVSFILGLLGTMFMGIPSIGVWLLITG